MFSLSFVEIIICLHAITREGRFESRCAELVLECRIGKDGGGSSRRCASRERIAKTPAKATIGRLVLELNVRETRRHAGPMIPLLALFAKQLSYRPAISRSPRSGELSHAIWPPSPPSRWRTVRRRRGACWRSADSASSCILRRAPLCGIVVSSATQMHSPVQGRMPNRPSVVADPPRRSAVCLMTRRSAWQAGSLPSYFTHGCSILARCSAG